MIGQESQVVTSEIRSFHRVLRNRMTDEAVKYHSTYVRRNLRKLVARLDSNLPILCFYPIKNEIDLIPLYKEWLNQKRDLYFPVTDLKNYRLDFYRIRSIQDFALGTMNIPEPIDREDGLAFHGAEGIAVTPGLVFNRKGDRIGYGGGFYDRFFASHPMVLRVGVSYGNQVELNLMSNPWDMPLDYLATEKRIYKF